MQCVSSACRITCKIVEIGLQLPQSVFLKKEALFVKVNLRLNLPPIKSLSLFLEDTI
jgi:hypothetical protein